MSLADDLLDTARRLAATALATQGDLRRAISTAYYALFRRLIEEAVALLVADSDQQRALARRFEHKDMRKVCQLVLKSPIPQFAVPFFGTAASADLKIVAKAFDELLDRRETADYDPGARFIPDDASAAVKLAEDAFDALARLTTSDVRPFLVLLLIGEPRR